MKGNISKHLPLIIGIGVPVVFLLLVFIFSFLLPNVFVNPSYNFLYIDSYYYDAYYYDAKFAVQNQKLSFNCTSDQYRNCSNVLNRVKFYKHDFSKDANVQITLEDAQQLKLDSSDVSPDGYKFDTKSGSDYFIFPLFGSSSSSGFSIHKGWLSKSVSLNGQYYTINFVGWILS